MRGINKASLYLVEFQVIIYSFEALVDSSLEWKYIIIEEDVSWSWRSSLQNFPRIFHFVSKLVIQRAMIIHLECRRNRAHLFNSSAFHLCLACWIYHPQILLENILPAHVAQHFLKKERVSQDLYHESYSAVGVLFASIPNYKEFYDETDVNKQGLECLRLLNEIICDFDKLLLKPKFSGIEKIKTIGSTYMLASGLRPGKEEGAFVSIANFTLSS